MSGGTAAQAWADTVAACTVGADRAGTPTLPGGLDVPATGGAEGWLLAAAATAPWRMAGVVPETARASLVEPLQDPHPECGAAAAARLEAILSNPKPQADLCRLATAAGVRAPAGLAPRLYAFTRKLPWSAEADAVMGGHVPWLRGLDDTEAPVTEADWSGDSLPRRVAALHVMRAADPAAGRAALEAIWKEEDADARAKLLAAFGTGLSEDDEPFLEARLDDRSGQVRTEAARLLAILPGSRWSLRMGVRAAAAVQFRPGRLLSRDTVMVTLPTGDKAAQCDGLEVKQDAGWKSRLLRQVVAAAPLTTWKAAPPLRWIAAAMAGDWAASLVPGWAAAAARERDMDWAGALLDALVDTWPEQPMSHGRVWGFDALKLVAPVVPPRNLERAVGSTLHRTGTVPAGTLELCDHAWSLTLTRWALDWVAARVSENRSYILRREVDGMIVRPEVDSMLDLVATRGSVDAAAQLRTLNAELPEDMVPLLRRSFAEAAAVLDYRHAMQGEFNC